MNNHSSLKRILGGLAAFLLTAAAPVAHGQQSYVQFENTKSPDGKWCLGWCHGSLPIDLSDSEKFMKEMNPDIVTNHLISLKHKLTTTNLGTTHYDTGTFAKNRGAIHALWRKDSRVVIVEEPARFGSARLVLVEIIDADRPHFPAVSDAIPLTQSIKEAAHQHIIKLHPDKKDAMEGATIRIMPKKWLGERKVECQVYAEQPKQDLIYEGTITFTLPELKVTAE